MCATLSKGTTYTDGMTVTHGNLNALVDSATISGIVNADIDAGAAIAPTKLAQITTAGKVSGASLTGLASIPAGAGIIPVANIDVGTDASKIVQLTAAAKYPAVDGSLITGITGRLTAGTPCVQNPFDSTSVTTQAHGLGAVPTFVVAYMECVSEDAGYSAGDRIHGLGFFVNGVGAGCVIEYDATNVLIISYGALQMLNKGSALSAALTDSKWKIVATPYLLT